MTSTLARAGLVCGAFFAAAELGRALSLPGGFATFWPPSGVLLAVLLRTDPRAWPWLVLATGPANLAFDVLHGRSATVALAYWTAHAVEAVVGATIVRRVIGTQFTLRRVRHVVALAAFGALGSSMLGAAIGAGASALWQHTDQYRMLWKGWWMADTIGTFAVAPFILAWSEPVHEEDASRRGRTEWLAFVLVTAIISGLVFARREVPWIPPRLLSVVGVPALGWAAWRLGPRATGIGVLVIVMLGMKNHLDGVGLLAAAGPVTPASMLIVEALVSGIIITFLLITAGVAEWNALELALRRANELKREFVSTMSHELRTPLAAILGYVEMARDPRFDAGKRLAFLDDIDRAGRQLLELIEATLDVGRLESGRDQPRLEPVSLPGFWEDLRAGCVTMPRQSGVDLRWGEPVPDLVLITDRRKLKVVMRNLITNALKFTERGWVRVDAEVAPSAVVLRVQDSGIGIHRDDQARIFEMYRQADSSDTRRYGGTGLGLHIVRRFVEQLGGTITLESAPGQGSTFTVTLPGVTRAQTAA